MKLSARATIAHTQILKPMLFCFAVPGVMKKLPLQLGFKFVK
jgi:hypothetical protein